MGFSPQEALNLESQPFANRRFCKTPCGTDQFCLFLDPPLTRHSFDSSPLGVGTNLVCSIESQTRPQGARVVPPLSLASIVQSAVGRRRILGLICFHDGLVGCNVHTLTPEGLGNSQESKQRQKKNTSHFRFLLTSLKLTNAVSIGNEATLIIRRMDTALLNEHVCHYDGETISRTRTWPRNPMQ